MSRGAMGALIGALFCAGALTATLLVYAGSNLQARLGATPAAPSATLSRIIIEEPPADPEGLSTVALVDKVLPSIVSIHLYQGRSSEPFGSGSGVVLTADGYIVTNAHVVEGARSIEVELAGGEVYMAELVGMDIYADIAVIKIEARSLTPAEFGDSDAVVVGQRAIALGNAVGLLPGSPTQGIISGVGREIPVEASDGTLVTMTLLQTDAAINPGNSGGALCNAYGQVIGINVAKLYSVDIDNIGFAIPTNEALPLAEAMMAGHASGRR